jgi:hypothetical protein|tara:strand:+ start:1498 stop:1701 length:204 start_codon:yes stop_codon:yes gene_type:complete
MKLDLKTILALSALLFTIAGFYYTTNARLNDAESEIGRLQKQVGQLEKSYQRLQRMVVRHGKKESHK